MPDAVPVTTTAPVTTTTPTTGTPAPEGTKIAPTTIEESYEVTIDGKPEKLTLSELKKHASLGKAAQSRFEEAAKMRKEADKVLSKVKSPKDAIKFLTDPERGLSQQEIQSAFEDWYHENVIEKGKLTPEQLKMKEMEAELGKYKDRDAQTEAEKKKESEAAENAKDMTALQKEIMKILDDTGYTKTPFALRRVAYWTRVNEAKNLKATPELVVKQMRQESQQILQDEVKNRDGASLVDFLGEEIVAKIRNHDLAKIRAKRAALSPGAVETAPTGKKDDNAGRLSSRDVQDNLNKMLRTKRW